MLFFVWVRENLIYLMPISSPLTSPVTFHSFAALESFQILISWHGLFSLYWGCSHTQVTKQNVFQDGRKKGKKKRKNKRTWHSDLSTGAGKWTSCKGPTLKGCFLQVSNEDMWDTRGRARLIPSPLTLVLLWPTGAGSTAEPTHFAKWAFSAVVPHVLYRSTPSHTSKCSYS